MLLDVDLSLLLQSLLELLSSLESFGLGLLTLWIDGVGKGDLLFALSNIVSSTLLLDLVDTFPRWHHLSLAHLNIALLLLILGWLLLCNCLLPIDPRRLLSLISDYQFLSLLLILWLLTLLLHVLFSLIESLLDILISVSSLLSIVVVVVVLL